jgi:hypothetical protein
MSPQGWEALAALIEAESWRLEQREDGLVNAW